MIVPVLIILGETIRKISAIRKELIQILSLYVENDPSLIGALNGC